MIQKKILFGFVVLFSILSIILSFFRNTLILSEYSQMGYSELQYYFPLTLFILFCVFAVVFFLVLGIMLHNKPHILLKKKQLIIVCSAILIFALGFTTASSAYSIVSAKQIERSKNIFDFVEEQPKEEIPSEYEFVFPFFTDIDDYYSFKVISTPQAQYIHAQNYGAYVKGMVVYDVEFFNSDNRSLLQQYTIQKTENAVKTGNNTSVKGKEKNVEGVGCIVYEQGNYLQIRIIEDDNYFSIVFDNLYDVSGGTVADFEKLAIDIYSKIELINNTGEITQGTNNTGDGSLC